MPSAKTKMKTTANPKSRIKAKATSKRKVSASTPKSKTKPKTKTEAKAKTKAKASAKKSVSVKSSRMSKDKVVEPSAVPYRPSLLPDTGEALTDIDSTTLLMADGRLQHIFDSYKILIPSLATAATLTGHELDRVVEDCFHVRMRGEVGLSPKDLAISLRAEKIMRNSGYYDNDDFIDDDL